MLFLVIVGSDCQTPPKNKIKKSVDFFEHNLTGVDGSSARRDRLCEAAGLPSGMTPNALLEALNLLYTYDQAIELMKNAGKD